MTVNPTNKPQLPTDSNLITKLNLTLPITSPKILVETSRQLRTYYFFYQLPDEWISIKNTTKKENTKPNLPSSLLEIQTSLKELDQSQTIQLPITTHEQIADNISQLHKYFSFQGLPPQLFELPNLPDPHWDIFDNYFSQS